MFQKYSAFYLPYNLCHTTEFDLCELSEQKWKCITPNEGDIGMANYEKQVEQEAAYPTPISLYNCYRTVRHEKRGRATPSDSVHCPVTVVQRYRDGVYMQPLVPLVFHNLPGSLCCCGGQCQWGTHESPSGYRITSLHSRTLEFVIDIFVRERRDHQTPAQWRAETLTKFSPPSVLLKAYSGHKLNILSQVWMIPTKLLLGTDLQSQLGFSLVAETGTTFNDLLTGEVCSQEPESSDAPEKRLRHGEPDDSVW